MARQSAEESSTHIWSGMLMVVSGAILLSAKGILSKLLYLEGLDFQEVITLRSLFALPLFWLWGLYSAGPGKLFVTDRKGIYAALFAGVSCYYVGGTLDFYALTLIDAGLERVLLYTYPTMIVIALAVMHRRLPSLPILVALIMTYIGIALAVGVFEKALWQANSFGALLVLICALTYAAYFFANDRLGKRLGSEVFTVYAMTAATFALLIHFTLTHSFSDINISLRAWLLFAIMVVFVTVVPLFLLAEGVKRIGAQRAGILSTVGPASTIILASILLHEQMRWFQYAGVLVTLLGIMFVEWKQKQAVALAD